jgi:GDP-L-fucose synthase
MSVKETTVVSSEKKFIVTGGNGFLGQKVVKELESQGFTDVFVPRSSEYDLKDPTQVRKLLNDHPADTVIHLAAKAGGIGANRTWPGEYFYDNALMGIHVIEECRTANIAKLVLVGTICSYPKFSPVPFVEEDIWDGYPEETNAPYGLAKKMLLVQAQAYRDQYGMNAIYLMPANLYGPGDNFDTDSSHVIPALIKKFSDAKKADAKSVEIWGSGTATRDFLYVEDAAQGIVLAAENYNTEQPINLGSGYEISIIDLANQISDLVGFSGEITLNPAMPDGQPRRVLNVTKASQLFGFEADTKLRDGLRKTIAYWNTQE